MKAPENWHKNSNNDILDNLLRIKTTKKELDKYLNDHKGSILLLAYTKYRPEEHPGLIPVIQFNLRSNQSKSFSEFTSIMGKSAEGFKKFFKDFKYIDSTRIIDLGGKKVVYFSAKFSITTKNLDTIHSRTRTYAVPFDDRFLQINFTDGPSDNCSILYDELLKTLKFN
jgi:hypothetical protein